MNKQLTGGKTIDWLIGGGEMGDRIRSFDWSQTPVGAIETWSQSLRANVSMMVANSFPMCIFWGAEFVLIYNDGYAVMAGDRHPEVLGQSCPIAWAGIWKDSWEEIFTTVCRTRQASTHPQQQFAVNRFGYLEELYCLIAYSPLLDDNGEVGGVLITVAEVTGDVLGKRRLQTLRDLGSRPGKARSVESGCQLAAEVLAENLADIPFALIYLLNADGKATLTATVNLAPGTAASPISIDVTNADSTNPWRLSRSTQIQQMDDLAARFGALPGGVWTESPQTALVIPLMSQTESHPVGFLIAGISPRRALDSDYQEFLTLAAGQVTAMIANVRAFEEERRRAEALAELDRAKTTFFSNVSHEFRTPLTLILAPLEEALASLEAGGSGEWGVGSGEWEGKRVDEHSSTYPPIHLSILKQQLEIADRNAQRLLKLVNTLLDFSRIEAGRIQANYEPTDLSTYTADLASVFRSAIESAGMQLVVDCPPLPEPVYVDREMWEKIVLNLLSNAFKFTFEGEIAVSLRWIDREAEGDREDRGAGSSSPSPSSLPLVLLKVCDTGTGIPTEELPHLFERFYRVKGARGRSYEGSGIGLSLVQELVKLHGGTVEVSSEVNQGTTFTITIPTGCTHLPPDQIATTPTLTSTAIRASTYVEEALRWLPEEGGRVDEWMNEGVDKQVSEKVIESPPTPHSPLPTPHTPHPPHLPKILLADDNADMRDYVKRLLQDRYTVEAVGDGQAALTAIHHHLPDLVLTDVMMPGMDGFELLQTLRADPETREIPIILLSARAGEESRVEGLEAGADDYLIKPFSARELLARVDANLRLGQMRRETALRQLNETLEQRVQERTAQLQELNQEMEAFTYSVSHDLRAPLRAIQGLARIFLQDYSQQLDARGQNYAQRLLEAGARLDTLIGDLLAYSHITRAEIRLQSVSLTAALEQVLAQLEAISQAQPADLQIQTPFPTVLGHSATLVQVISNLISNALKFVEPGVQPQIRVWAEERGNWVRLWVEDNGIGIAPQHQERIFRVFERLHGREVYPGTGIGLAIVRKGVERMGGTVGVESEIGKGSRFWVELQQAKGAS